MKSLVCITIFAAILCFASAVRIKNCGGKADVDYKNIKITGCSRDNPYCIFKKNHTAQLSIPFAPKGEVTSLKAKVDGIIAGIPIPFPLPKAEACGESLTCPIAPHTNVTYFEGLPVEPVYPSITLKVKWELVNQNGINEVCILIPVRLQ
ncbi:MD-2-related lipid-recognition domain [Trinorchestia longiramus]|nr:MD-2-related lipid-recognition domain [Trinorchestia longiramus]